jgi:hypothetical protein
LKKILLFILSVNAVFLHAQSIAPQLISSDGNFSTSAAGSISWSIGEPISDTYSASQQITKGFQQPKSIYITSLAEDNKPGGAVFAFPSPATNEVQLDFSTMQNGEYTIEIFDVTGKELANYKIDVRSETHKETLDLQNYAEGLYVVKITNTVTSKTKYFRLVKQK